MIANTTDNLILIEVSVRILPIVLKVGVTLIGLYCAHFVFFFALNL